MRRPIWAMTGIKRTVKGNKEVAKWVARSSRVAVAWSIEASFLARGRSLVPPVISRESRLPFQGPGQEPEGLGAPPGEKPPQFLGNPWHWRDCTRPSARAASGRSPRLRLLRAQRLRRRVV